jgi:riboflavin synthase
MFTGIIETLGEIKQIDAEQGNRVFTIQSNIASELKVDQSISHNGVCLTVSSLDGPDRYQVVAVSETLQRSNLDGLSIGELVNLERSIILGDRLDGHLVQGHVDHTAICKRINETKGSWAFVFEFETNSDHVLIEKGSICVNGVSLTCFNVSENSFEIAIIPYTYENTNFRNLKSGGRVNLEFDVIGKYVQAALKKRIKN